MHESFLHYIWQFQYFNKQELKTTEGEALQIINQGFYNTDAGPDFSNAKITIGNMAWAGTIEIHTRSSEWNNHLHVTDRAYNNVILHVVWSHDKQVTRSDGSFLPTLELKDRISEALLFQYKKLVSSGLQIPCQHSLSSIPVLTRLSMLEKALMYRLEKKAKQVGELLEQNKGDWEETTYQLLAANFGFKINKEPFFQLAKTLPYRILLKHISQPQQVEALLFGHAGFLDTEFIKDDYFLLLKREYKILAAKYKLEPLALHESNWKFLRLRPANFPTLRLAQFASLLIAHANLFSKLKESETPASLTRLFEVTQSNYWKAHYRFGVMAKGSVAALGETSIQNILINTMAPLLVAYGKNHDQDHYVDRALHLLQAVPAEENKITRTYAKLNWVAENAFDSQGFIELYNSFCSPRQCLQCNIGTSLLRPV